jgi:ubiquinone biosynthesis protein
LQSAHRPTPISAPARALPVARRRAAIGGVRLALRALGIEPVARLSLVALGVLLDRIRGAPRERSVARVVAALGALKGAFAKAGQFAALRVDVLPPAATDALGSLRDRVPPLPFAPVRAAVESELGAPLEALFAEFDPGPVGAASIAQVHLARLPDGQRVAVKVQYPWLAASLRADLAVLRALFAWWSRRSDAGTRRERRRLFEEFSRGLREELDFEREARVALEIAANLSGDPQIVVPRPIASHSGRRVLTMTYHPAVRIDDRAGLARLGVEPARVLEVLARAYAKQAFVDGLFHADPHPGNLFVLDEPGAATRPRLLFVDFGLSRRLEPELRREMRRGIYALLRRDLDGFVGIMQGMGMIAPGAAPGVRAAVAAMFERLGSGSALSLAGSQVLPLKDEAKTLLQQTPGLQLPNDLLLFAKTLSYLFALGDRLSPDTDLLRLCLPYLLQFLAERDREPEGATGLSACAGADPGAG